MLHHFFRRSMMTLCASLAFAAPSLAQDEEGDARQVLATVNGTEITLGHLIILRAGLPPQFAQVDPERLFDGILDQLIQQTLLAQSIEGDPSFQSQILIENETRAIIASEVMSKLMDGAISDEALQAAYEERYLSAEKDVEYLAAHILVQTEEEAQDLITKLNEGEEFSALAREFSIGPSGAEGGDLGWFAKGVMVEPFFNAVEALEPGEVSPPVKTDFGWHVITLRETRLRDHPELESVREELEQQLRGQALEDQISRLEKLGTIDRIDTTEFNFELINDTTLLED